MQNNQLNFLTGICLKFFGKMTASATHELKNSLAIINENAGLLNDLVTFSKNGGPSLSADRMLKLSQTLKQQVMRADNTIQRLNRFSHTVDKDSQMIDLEDTIRLTIDVSSRLLDMMGVSLKLSTENGPVMIRTHLFYLETFLWRAIETACNLTGEDKTISIELKKTPSPSIWFCVNRTLDEEDDLFTSKTDIQLLEQLSVTLKMESDNYRFGLVWPSQD